MPNPNVRGILAWKRVGPTFVMGLVEVERNPHDTTDVYHVVIQAYLGEEGKEVRRYAVSFRPRERGGNRLRPYNKQRYNEVGDPESSNIIVPKEYYNPMAAWAAAIILEKKAVS